MKEYYTESMGRGVSYKRLKWKEGRLTGLVTSCVLTAL